MLSGMSIEDFMNKIKPLVDERGKQRLFAVSAVFLSGLAAFGVGRLTTGPEKPPIYLGHFDALPGAFAATVQGAASSTPVLKTAKTATSGGQGSVFSSKNGTKYYPKACKGGKRVAEANRIWFDSPAEAEKLGMTLAAGCKL